MTLRSLLAVILLTAGCAATSVALPPDAKVEAPDATIPRDQAAFAGKWEGIWDQTLPHILVVERITADSVDVVYAWGYSVQWRMNPGWNRAKGKFEGPRTLVVKFPRPATATYIMQPDGTLDATYEWSGPRAKAKLTRMKE